MAPALMALLAVLAAAPGPRPRRLLLAAEGVALELPTLRTPLVGFDPRALGTHVALAGAGVLGRFRAHRAIGLELGVRSGSVRYRGGGDTSVSEDLVLADAGLLLYVASGEIAKLALSTGTGGLWHGVRYDLSGGRSGAQTFGSGFVRVGVELELLVKRVAFLLGLRSYGVVTDRARVRNRGELLEGVPASARTAPTTTFQSWIGAAVGVGYRF